MYHRQSRREILLWFLLCARTYPLEISKLKQDVSRRSLLASFVLSQVNQPASAVINGAGVTDIEAAQSGAVALWIDLDDCEVCRHDVPAACSGVLVGPRLVLSAQHCLDIPESLGGRLSRVVFGSDIFNTKAPTIDVESYLRPIDVGLDINAKKGTQNSLQNDLLLIKLKSPAPKDWNIATIVAPSQQYSRFDLYGFGDTLDDSDDYTSGQLKRIQLIALSEVNSQTPSFYSMPTNRKSGTCNGDSGGPALLAPAAAAGLEITAKKQERNLDDSASPQLLGVLSSNTMPCTGSNAIFMNPRFFKAFLRRASKELGEPIDGL